MGHPEVRPRAIAAAGVLAAAMGYIDSEDVPGLPTSISLDPDKVSDVVDSLRGLLIDMGRSAPTQDSVAHGLSPEDSEAHIQQREQILIDLHAQGVRGIEQVTKVFQSYYSSNR